MRCFSSHRICFYVVATHLGGAERSLLELLKQMNRKSNTDSHSRSKTFLCWVVLPKDHGPLVEALREEGIDYSIVNMPSLFLKVSRSRPGVSLLYTLLSVPSIIAYGAKVLWLLKKMKPVLIHTTGLKCHYLGAILGTISRIQVLWHLRDIYPLGFNLSLLTRVRRVLNVFVIANSKATARAFEREQTEIPVIYNGLDPSEYYPQPNSQFRQLFGISSLTPVIGLVGVFSRWKGQLEFIEMANQLTTTGVDARFVLIGDLIYDTVTDIGFKQELIDKVNSYGLKDRFHFYGFKKDVTSVLNGLDILVHASLKPEPFGRVVLEAMACGIAVVAANAGGITEFVEHKKTGYLYSPGNIEEMTAAIQEALKNPEERAKYVKEARDVFLRRFTAQSYVEGIIQCYNRILVQKTHPEV